MLWGYNNEMANTKKTAKLGSGTVQLRMTNWRLVVPFRKKAQESDKAESTLSSFRLLLSSL